MARLDDSTTQSKKKRPDSVNLDSSQKPSGSTQKRQAEPIDTTKPLQLQRRRVFRACESCRRKKIKCDGCEPTCSQCVASGSQCNWLQTKDRAALSRHYVQELEQRLLHMESIFTQIAPVLDQIGTVPNGGAVSSLASALPGQKVHSSGDPGRTETSSPAADSPSQRDRGSSEDSAVKAEDEVSESFGQLALDEHGHKRWIGGSSTISLIQSFRAVTATSPVVHRVSPMEDDPRLPGPSANKLYFPASVFFGKVRALPGPEEVEYPERDLADKLVEAYFARFHFLIPIIDKPSFMKQYAYVMDNRHDPSVARGETAFIALVFAVFACAASLIDDSRLHTEHRDDGGIGMVYYERSLILNHISHASIQVAHVQCFILMSAFLCSVNCLPQAWILTGQAVRIGQDLGLHRSPRRHPGTSIEKETLRKIWWGVYTLDRMLALALGRPLGINDLDCDVELPVDIDDDQLPEYFNGAFIPPGSISLMTGFIFLIKLYEIAGRVTREVYALDKCRENLEPEKKVDLQRTVEALDNDLNKWCEELPSAFKSQSTTNEQVSMGAVLCSHYYSVLTTLHRNFLPVKRDQQLTTPKSTVKAVSSARSCIRLAPSMKNVVPPSHHLAFFIQHLFSSAVILLLYAMHQSEPKGASAALEEAKSSLTALESWEGEWPGAKKCKELLLELTMTASEAVAGGLRCDGQDQPQPQTPATPSDMASPMMQNVAATTASMIPPERRRSITISTLSTGTASAGPSSRRQVKVQQSDVPRRNKSRDPNMTRRAVAPYNSDGRRARSASRRRPDETESREQQSLASLYHASFSSPGSAQRSSTSPHNSPPTANLPSPTLAPNESTASHDPTRPAYAAYPMMASANSSSPMNQQQPDYNNFGLHNHSLTGGMHPIWASPGSMNGGGQTPGQEMFPSSPISPTTDTGMYLPQQSYGIYNSSGGIDPSSYMPFDSSDVQGMVLNTPITASFDTPGLPFRGLDFIRNYNNPVGGFSSMEPDSIWSSYDPSAFEIDPNISFNPFTNDHNGGAGENVRQR